MQLRSADRTEGMAIDPNDPGIQLALKALLNAAATPDAAKTPKLSKLWIAYWDQCGRHHRSARRTRDCWIAIKDAIGKDGEKLEDRPAATVTAEIVEEVRDFLRADISRTTGRVRTPGTRNRNLAIIPRVLKWACEQKLIPPMVLKIRKEPGDKIRKTVIRTEEEFAKLLAASDAWIRALCLVLFDGGLRKMEAINLRRDQLIRRPNGGAVVAIGADECKGAYPRHAQLTRRAVEALDALPDRGPYFFSRPDGAGPYSAWYMYHKFQHAAARSGIQPAPGERLLLHNLRSSFAYCRRALDHWNERQVMAAGGWKTRTVLDRYGFMDQTEMFSAQDLVEERLAKEKRHGPVKADPKRVGPAKAKPAEPHAKERGHAKRAK